MKFNSSMPKDNSNSELKDHQLFAANQRLWKTLKRENKISKSKAKKVRKISLVIWSLALFRWLQRPLLRLKIKSTDLNDDAPIFIVGHWRSGTTHLHYLLSQDDRHMHLGSFQAFTINAAFTTKWFLKPIMKRVMPSTRYQDDVKIDVDAPTEDEHALVNMTRMSGMHMFFFPKNNEYFDKFNCFEGITEEELKEWKSIYASLLKQVEVFNKEDKKLVLKNPHSTARIKVLSEMYPNAKFLFIHRNPYEVFNSTITLYERAVRSQFLQDFTEEELNELILSCYEKMMSNYLKQRESIRPEQLIEVGYDNLIVNPVEELEKIYKHLNLDGFQTAKPKLEAYLETLKEYKVNPARTIDPAVKEIVKKRWGFAFKEWGYQA
ncbi:MAG: hypothetical protein ACJASQ_003528 [Crocinitomicaceae bacterium]|jgi:hypothetical protein